MPNHCALLAYPDGSVDVENQELIFRSRRFGTTPNLKVIA